MTGEEAVNNKIEFWPVKRPNYYVGMAYDEEYDLLVTVTSEGLVNIKGTKNKKEIGEKVLDFEFSILNT